MEHILDTKYLSTTIVHGTMNKKNTKPPACAYEKSWAKNKEPETVLCGVARES